MTWKRLINIKNENEHSNRKKKRKKKSELQWELRCVQIFFAVWLVLTLVITTMRKLHKWIWAFIKYTSTLILQFQGKTNSGYYSVITSKDPFSISQPVGSLIDSSIQNILVNSIRCWYFVKNIQGHCYFHNRVGRNGEGHFIKNEKGSRVKMMWW